MQLTLQVQNTQAAPERYLVVPLTVQAQGARFGALEAELRFDPAQLELIGIMDDAGALNHVEEDGHGTVLVTTLLDSPASLQQVRLVVRLRTDASASLAIRLTQAVDEQGRPSQPTTPAQVVTIKSGEGGATERPAMASLEQQLQRSRGLLTAQTLTVTPLKVPTTLDASWAPYELGDVDQSRSVNLADTALLSRFLLGQQVPTGYQAYASDLLDAAVCGAQQVDAADLLALLAKSALTAFKVAATVPSVHPLAVSANSTQGEMILAGNAGYGPVAVGAVADQTWITVTR
jgi:hypothetical protein